jgi:flagellar biogenesis protein FliO
MSSLVLIIAITFFLGYLVGNLMRSVASVSHRRAKRTQVRLSGTQITPS